MNDIGNTGKTRPHSKSQKTLSKKSGQDQSSGGYPGQASAGKGPGYERWAKVFNLKQMAQTINFLTENNITDYETLVEQQKP